MDRPVGADGILGNHCQDVVVHAEFLQGLNGMGHPAKGPPPCRIHPVPVVDLLGPVQRYPHQEVIFRKKGCPLCIDQQPIGLQGKMQPGLIFVFPFCFRHRVPEEIQPGQGGFPALECYGALLGHRCQSMLQHCGQGVPGHQAIAGSLPLAGLIGIKAIMAAHIAQAAGRLDHQMK